MPKISVITVCYNAAALLTRTVNSVLEQTYHDLEYIVVDGASDDNTGEIIRALGSKVNNFLSEPDTGLYDAMNKGIKLATGDLVVFLNAGDYFVTNDVLEFTVSKMNLKEADLFFGRIVWNDPRSKDIALSDHSWVNFSWDLKKSNFPHPATFYKKSLFNTIGLFNLNFPIAADYEWNVRALVSKRVKFQYINIIVTVFFADGISNNQNFALQHELELNQIDRKYFIPFNIHEKLSKTKKTHFRDLIEKVASKVYNCRLARVYY